MAKMRAHRTTSTRFSSILGLTSLVFSSTVFAAGFQIQEQNVTNLGTAYSGTAAWAPDASTAFYNPAGLTHIPNKQIVASAVLILGSFDFTATSTNVPAIANTPVPGPQTDDPGGPNFVPSIHYSAHILDDWWFGLSVSAPFGLNSSYDEAKVMRYVATDSVLRTLDIAPSLAWKAKDWLSLSAGLDFLYAEAKLEAQSHFGNGTITTAAPEGFQKNRADDWAFGWHVATLIDFSESTRVGIQYRSKFNVKAEGDSRNLVALQGTVPVGAHVTRRVNANVTLPETVVLSGYHEFTDAWAVMADVAWVNWSRFKTLRLKYFPPSTPSLDTFTDENFKDTWRVALGVNYTHTPQWQFRAGLAWDESPVRDAFRTARIPDSDRWWLGLGVGYTMLECLHFDVGYAHLFFDNAHLVDRGPISIASGNPVLPFNYVEGDFDANANIFGVQVRYDFV